MFRKNSLYFVFCLEFIDRRVKLRNLRPAETRENVEVAELCLAGKTLLKNEKKEKHNSDQI